MRRLIDTIITALRALHVNQMRYHIGWCDKLRDISMRHFVCPPQK